MNEKRGAVLSWRMHALIFLAAFTLLVTRRPDAILHPVFFAEDGTTWYPQAYALGWFHALFHPKDGYFQTLPRLGAALALLVRFRYGPLLENILALALQAAPVSFLLSQRCRNWGSLSFRALLAFIYIAIPNSSEVHGSVEEGQWHLAILACLVVLADEPLRRAWRIFDVCVLAVFGLSGPFVVMLLPLAVLYWWIRRQPWTAVNSVSIAVCALIQGSALLGSTIVNRPKMMLGATPELFIRLLAGHVYLAALYGQYAYWGKAFWVFVLAAVLGTGLFVYCFVKASIEWRLFLSFCALVFAAGLKFPMVAAPQWPILDTCPGIRYWYVPTVGFAWAVAWVAFNLQPMWLRVGAVLALASMIIGIFEDWRYKPFDAVGFPHYARWFMMAPAGTMVVFPIIPGGWVMRLTKHNPACTVMPEGEITEPGRYATVTGQVSVNGTVTPEVNVQILVDRKLQQRVIPTGHSWKADLDMGALSPGVHEIEARVDEGNGCAADIALVPVKLTR